MGKEILACGAAASFHFAAGGVLGFSAILIPQLQANSTDIKVDKSDVSWIASVVALIIPVGAIFTGMLVDWIGRVKTLYASSLPMTLGWILIATAHNLPMLLLGRALTAFAAAMATAPAIVYITEVARPDMRGSLICICTALTSLGMVVIYAEGAYLNWRTLAWITISNHVIAIILVILFSPESPAWLVSKGRTADAQKSLEMLLKNQNKVHVAEEKLAEMIVEHNTKKAATNQKGSALTKFMRGLFKPTGLKPLLLLTFIFAFQQFSGIYITIFYAVTFFTDMGASVDPYFCAVGIGVVRLVVGLATTVLIKKYGRRPLLLTSGTGMFIFLSIAGYITKEVSEGHREPSAIPAFCILMYMTLGVIGLLTIPWTMTAEVFALEIRGMAQGLILSIAHILMFIALKIYPFLVDILGHAYAVLWLFAGVALTAVVFIFIFVPETHKKTLQEIQDYFQNNTVYILQKRTQKREESNEEAEEKMLKKEEPPTNVNEKEMLNIMDTS